MFAESPPSSQHWLLHSPHWSAQLTQTWSRRQYSDRPPCPCHTALTCVVIEFFSLPPSSCVVSSFRCIHESKIDKRRDPVLQEILTAARSCTEDWHLRSRLPRNYTAVGRSCPIAPGDVVTGNIVDWPMGLHSQSWSAPPCHRSMGMSLWKKHVWKVSR